MATLKARFDQLIFSPRGTVEGVLLSLDGSPVQVVFDKNDDESSGPFMDLVRGKDVTVAAAPADPSPKGRGAHPVYAFERLLAIDGRKPTVPKRAKPTADYVGTVVRLNFARHGEANGVVLDSGDFIHTKPEAMASLKLKVGDAVAADGDAQWLATGTGWAVEARRVNGKAIGSH